MNLTIIILICFLLIKRYLNNLNHFIINSFAKFIFDVKIKISALQEQIASHHYFYLIIKFLQMETKIKEMLYAE